MATPLETKVIAELLLYIASDFLANVREELVGTEKESWTDEEVMIWIVEQRLGPLYAPGVEKLSSLVEDVEELKEEVADLKDNVEELKEVLNP